MRIPSPGHHRRSDRSRSPPWECRICRPGPLNRVVVEWPGTAKQSYGAFVSLPRLCQNPVGAKNLWVPRSSSGCTELSLSPGRPWPREWSVALSFRPSGVAPNATVPSRLSEAAEVACPSAASRPPAVDLPCGCQEPRPRHATRRYSWINPPSRFVHWSREGSTFLSTSEASPFG